MCKKSVDQHLIFPNLYSISTNKILATEFMTVKNRKNISTVKSTT